MNYYENNNPCNVYIQVTFLKHYIKQNLKKIQYVCAGIAKALWKRLYETWWRVTVSRRNRDGRACHGIGVLSQFRRAKIANASSAERKRDSSRSVRWIQNGHPPFSRRDVRRSARASCNWRAWYFPHTSIASSIGAIVYYPSMNLPTLRLNSSPRIDNFNCRSETRSNGIKEAGLYGCSDRKFSLDPGIRST